MVGEGERIEGGRSDSKILENLDGETEGVCIDSCAARGKGFKALTLISLEGLGEIKGAPEDPRLIPIVLAGSPVD